MIPEFWLMLAMYGPQAYGVSLEDLGTFPSHDVSLSCQRFANKHAFWLRSLAEPIDLAERERLSEWRYDHGLLCTAWDALEYAQRPEIKDEVRLAHLIGLKQQLGDEAYYAGQMPPCCPWWRFEER